MQEITLEYVEQLAHKLPVEDQLHLIARLERQVNQQPLAVEDLKQPGSLRGLWAGKFPDDFDIDAALYEIRHEWEKEWPEVFDQ
jgi:hypothetical protein